jgi:2-polyprenyl-3-methyl-5-hydroxy-6-metoxy-1,4-benzoquinol methylase
VSLETMEHIADPRRLVDELVSALRPGGVLIVSVPTSA